MLTFMISSVNITPEVHKDTSIFTILPLREVNQMQATGRNRTHIGTLPRFGSNIRLLAAQLLLVSIIVGSLRRHSRRHRIRRHRRLAFSHIGSQTQLRSASRPRLLQVNAVSVSQPRFRDAIASQPQSMGGVDDCLDQTPLPGRVAPPDSLSICLPF